MAVGFRLQTEPNGSKTSGSLLSNELNSYYQIQSEQLGNHQNVLCARIVYYDYSLQECNEAYNFSGEQLPFSYEFLDYLRSEEWLVDYPVVREIHEFVLEKFQLVSCICPINYINKKPEYIQIISRDRIGIGLKQYLKDIAILLIKYQEIELGYIRQKSEINLLEQVVNKVGHQLRNSLSLISLYSHNLYLGLEDKNNKEQAKIIQKRIENLDKELTEIINCSQSKTLKVSQQDLRSIVIESIKKLEPLIVQRNIKFDISEISTKLEIDGLQIKQVFDNLLSNAIHFSPNYGVISCSWQIFKEEVFIQVSDEGKGIPPEDLHNIFNPFYSRRSGGTGLGLTIAKKIILDHQGNLWAKNNPEGGAEFCLVLPKKRVV